MTDISREAVDALLQGVTPGPWETVFDRQTWGWLEVDGPSFKIDAPTQATDLSLADEVQRKKDARFIAAARELVPALRAALDEADARAALPAAAPVGVQPTKKPDHAGLIANAKALLALNASGAATPRVPNLAVEIIGQLIATLAPAQPAHPDDLAVDRFAAAMKAKLANARAKGRGGWDDPAQCSVEFLADLLRGHVGKGNAGNFEDIANLAMMLHQRGADPAVLAPAQPAPDAPALDADAVAALVDAVDGYLDGVVSTTKVIAALARIKGGAK